VVSVSRLTRDNEFDRKGIEFVIGVYGVAVTDSLYISFLLVYIYFPLFPFLYLLLV
jgi:hypothetical protein